MNCLEKIKVDTDNIRSDLAKIVKEEFARYTFGTGKGYTYQDKLLFIDLMVQRLHHKPNI